MPTPIKDDDRLMDKNCMHRCLDLAREAAAAEEVPVGAVVVLDGRVLGEGRNRTREMRSALAHAEMIALQAAIGRARALPHEFVEGRLPGATLYCSLEPCFMCAGALLHARLGRVVFAAADPKFGACGSLANLPRDERLNHRCRVVDGVLAEESAQLLREFFQRLR